MTKQQRFIKGYRFCMDAAFAQLDLAVTYLEDGAPADAASCADLAAGFLREASTLRSSAMNDADKKKAAKS